jgi:predicted secreted protein
MSFCYRYRLLPAALAASLVVAAAPLRAETPAGVPAGEHDAAATVLHLTETAERTLKRDRLRFDLRAEATGADPARVQAEINKRMAAALERAKGVPAVRVETGGYTVYEDRAPNGPPRWRGSQSLALIGRDFAPLLQLAGELQGDGLVASGTSFSLARETARGAEDELTEEALRRLRERADRVASAMGLSVLRLRDIRVGNADTGRPPPMPMRAMAAAASAQPPVAEAGEATVQVSVDAEVLLAPAADASRP